jgi:hypothetical protein
LRATPDAYFNEDGLVKVRDEETGEEIMYIHTL